MILEFRTYNRLPDEARVVRTEVFMQEQGFVNEFDATDAIAKHIVAFIDNVPIGTCRIFEDDGHDYHEAVPTNGNAVDTVAGIESPVNSQAIENEVIVSGRANDSEVGASSQVKASEAAENREMAGPEVLAMPNEIQSKTAEASPHNLVWQDLPDDEWNVAWREEQERTQKVVKEVAPDVSVEVPPMLSIKSSPKNFKEEREVGVVRSSASLDGAMAVEGQGYIIGRVAVVKAYRGKKIGAYILKDAAREIKNLGGTHIRLAAQVQARGFYETLGYEAYGDEFDDEGCPHIWMQKNLV